jgi:hypothetical protein
MVATLTTLVIACLPWAGLQGRVSPRASAHLAANAAGGNGAPSCKGFRGAVHGTSVCVRYDRALNKLSKSNKRVMPGGATRELACDGQARLATVGLKLACVQRPPAPGRPNHVAVGLVLVEDTLYPRNRGKRITLDQHDGFWDFIHVWVAEDKQALELTIDYGILE